MIFDPYTWVLGYRWQTPTLIWMIAVGIGALWWVGRTPPAQRLAAFDVYLGGTLGALVLGRGGHVLLNSVYFRQNPTLIWQWHVDGGLNWQSAVIGAWVGAWLVARWRSFDIEQDRAAVVLALMALAGWWGCAAWGCAYGTAIARMADYPAWLTWDVGDIYRVVEPRFATQRLGMLVALVALGLALALQGADRLRGRQTALVLLCVAGGDLVLHTLRGDYSPLWAGVRAGQWLDIGVMIGALGWISWRTFAQNHSS